MDAFTEKGKTKTEFISRNHGHSRYEVIIKTTSHEHYRETEDFARRLIDHAKPMTNADRIRAMTDEQLAALLAHETYRIAEPFFQYIGLGITEEVCYCQRLNWLKQPVEVE